MKPRLIPDKVAPAAIKPMLDLENSIVNSGLEKSLVELVKIRASQINGCAYCIHMHTKDARARGESEERIYLLDAWHESPLYSARERGALTWTAALTLIAQTRAPDSDYTALQAEFSPEEQVKLTMLIGAINVWNRLAIGFRVVHPVESRRDAA